MFKIVILACFASTPLLFGQSKIEFWDTTRKGANFFNEAETRERFQAAKKIGVAVVRLVFNKWKSNAPNARVGDFLIGGKDSDFKALNAADLAQLKAILDWAHEAGIKVVVTNLSLPGLRWVQHNDGKSDFRLWEDFKYHAQTELFWRALATALKEHPAVVGYNILNEPHPEKVRPQFEDWYTGDYPKWYESVRNTPRDLNLFHDRIAKVIRSVDAVTPIVIDSGFYSLPAAFSILRPLSVENVLYSFHMYEPYSFTSYQNLGKFSYPAKAPIGESEVPPVIDWNRKELAQLLEPVVTWQKKHQVSSHRIFSSEFGVFRANQGAEKYLADVVSLLDDQRWHWAFYSFQEDSWAGMDYQLGPKKHEPGQLYPLEKRKEHYFQNSLFDVILKSLMR